jgi:hypothetical protein
VSELRQAARKADRTARRIDKSFAALAKATRKSLAKMDRLAAAAAKVKRKRKG